MIVKEFTRIAFPNEDGTGSNKDAEVDHTLVLACMNKFKLEIKNPSSKLTAAISYDRVDLLNWFKKNEDVVYDKIDIILGIYTQEFINAYQATSPGLGGKAGYVTAFIGLFNGATPAQRNGTILPLYNIGDLKPPTI